MAKTKKMALGGMGGAAKAAMQSVKSAPKFSVPPRMPIPSRGNIATQTPQSMPIPPRGQQANMPPPGMPASSPQQNILVRPPRDMPIPPRGQQANMPPPRGMPAPPPPSQGMPSQGMGNNIGSFLPKNAAMPTPQAMGGMPPAVSGAQAKGMGLGMKKGGMVSSKPKASSASSRGDGIATKGKTKGRFV